MERLNHHKWIKDERLFKTWHCSVCGAERYWDNLIERIVYVKNCKSYYMTPECRLPGEGYVEYKNF